MTPTPPVPLSAPQQALLADYAHRVHAATDAAVRDIATAAAAAAATRCRQAGATWAEMAEAMGITSARLRDWRGTLVAKAGPSQPVPGVPLRAPPHPLARAVLVATGDAKINGNDFAREAALIRRALLPHNIPVHERFNVELPELRRELDTHRPAVLHLAAHADFGAIHLCLGDRASAVLHADLSRAIRQSAVPPRLVVLSCCDSDSLAHDLAVLDSGPGRVATTVGWRGALIDIQAQAFAQRFYPMLVAGHSVIRSFDAPLLAIAAHWPGRARPQLFGDASAR